MVRVVRRDRRARACARSPTTRRSSRRSTRSTASTCSSPSPGRASSPSARSSSSSPAARRCTPTWATSGASRSQLAWYALVLPGLVLNYFGQAALLAEWPGQLIGDRSPFYEMAPDWAIVAARDPGHDGDGDRLAGAHLRRLLAHRAGGAARLSAAPRDPAHLRATHRPGLRPARELVADGRLRRPRDRVPHVEQPGRGVRHRRHHHDADHDVDLLPLRARQVAMVDAQGVARDRCPFFVVDMRVPRRQRAQDPARRLVPDPGRRSVSWCR